MVFITDGFFDIAIESWPEWDLNPEPLNSVQTLEPAELSACTQSQLSTATPISLFVQCHISFQLFIVSPSVEEATEKSHRRNSKNGCKILTKQNVY